MTVNLAAKFVSNSDKITNKIQGLNRLDQEIQKIAGSVTDTKRKVELGVNQTLAEVSKHSKAACNGQESEVKKIVADAEILQNKIDQLSQKYDLAINQNTALQKEDPSKSELISYIKKTHEDTIKKLNGLSEMTDTLGGKFVTSNDKILNKIQGLNRLDQLLQNIAGTVTDTKRKVELGVNQTLDEVSKYSKAGALNVQEAVCNRLNTLFKTSILDPKTGALVNATSKIENDVQQVLQKIGIMYQQIRSNADALNKLQDYFKISAHVPPSQISPAVISKEDLESTKKEIMNKIYIVTNSIGKIENEIVKINADNKQIKDLHKKSLENLENLKIYFNNNQELFTKIDKKLDNCNSKINNQENEEWKFNVTTAINGQQSDVKTILADAKLLQNKIDQLSQKYDLAIDQNTALQKEDHSKSELINYINKTHEDTIMKLDNLSKITVSLGENFRNNYDTIRNEIKDLNRLDQVMINTTYMVLLIPNKKIVKNQMLKKSWQTLNFYRIK
ncbi:extracellular matrix-binding protein ebh-like [Diabrotica virgifera virgifera]|uniref:Uncharacterized protein n=1 Tax=Diabrotica virgifera virgifera TaxID=50390 RepID=A0ABM5JY07_DIAVI|nr:extracellular matrix-binding protein ebh-like [Diabrotica virgifera virgifera]XP_050502825.1 extracellular matrix-binding protein ebh-like [Diabrotica virgifera virgifera]